MRKKKLWKSIVSTALCVGMMCNGTIPLMAMEKEKEAETKVESVTPDTPQQDNTKKAKLTTGGVEKVEELDFTGVKNDVSELDISEAEVNGFIEEREKIKATTNGNYGYNSLSTKEKKVYNLLLKSMIAFDVSKKDAECVQRSYTGNYYAAGKVDVSSYNMKKSEMERVYFALEADYLDFFWLDDTIGWEASGFYVKSWYIMVESDYMSYATRKATAQSIKVGVCPFLEKIDNAKAAKKSEMELELLIHDMIIGEVDYAYDWGGEPETATYAHSIVGVFDNNDATDVVCEGYAKAFQYLCGYAGLNSIYAVGYSTTGGYSGGHAWNLIKIDGKWYNVDLTWNDENGNEYDGYMYDYYNLPTSEFCKNQEHEYREDIFGGMYSVPNAVSTDASYYNYFSMNVTSSIVANDTTLLQNVKKAIESNEKRGDNLLRLQCDSFITLNNLKTKFQNSDFCNSLVQSLNNNGVVYKIDSVASYSKFNQLLVSVSKIYVENVCSGYVFGNPKEEMVVYEWKKRQKQDVTSNCNIVWAEMSSTKGNVTIKKGTQTIGTYGYTLVIPTIDKISAQKYSGDGICPVVSVKANGTVLQQNKDYIVEYKNNRNIGTAKVIIKGMGNYSGNIEANFDIVAKKMQELNISMANEKCVYTGTAQKPEIIVKDGSKVLWEGEDYTLSYQNNTKMGVAKVIIIGKGNYQGSKTMNFYIVPKKVSGVSLKSGSGKSLKFSFTKLTGVSGYEVSLYQGSKRVRLEYITKTSNQFKKLKLNTQYTFKVRAYINVNGKKYYGDYASALKVKTATKAPSKLDVSSKNKSAIIKWNKVSGASGYEVYMSGKKSSGYKKITTLSKNSKVKYTKKKLTKGKTYYFKVRTFTIKNKGKVYSEYSQVKKVKVK